MWPWLCLTASLRKLVPVASRCHFLNSNSIVQSCWVFPCQLCILELEEMTTVWIEESIRPTVRGYWAKLHWWPIVLKPLSILITEGDILSLLKWVPVQNRYLVMAKCLISSLYIIQIPYPKVIVYFQNCARKINCVGIRQRSGFLKEIQPCSHSKSLGSTDWF